MGNIKIASKFLTKSQASKVATKQRQLLKSLGKNKTHRVEILFAFNLWRTNKWFNQKKFGLPNPTNQDFIIIITEILKTNTSNMPATTQKQPPKPQITPSTIKKVTKPRKQKSLALKTISPTRQILSDATLAIISSYIFLIIPAPYYYHSVA